MTCPACNNNLTKVTVNKVELDVCKDGCAGVWFDNYEFEKFDEESEFASSDILDVEKNESSNVDFLEKRPCPKCDDITMMRHFFSVKHEVEMDECGFCGGIWLDDNELSRIRAMYPDEATKRVAFDVAFDDAFGSHFEALEEEAKEREKARAKRTMITKLLWRLS